jgi:hypothetical protein
MVVLLTLWLSDVNTIGAETCIGSITPNAEKLLKEYDTGYDKIKSAYSMLTIEGKCTHKEFRNDKEEKIVSTLYYWQYGSQKIRLDTFKQEMSSLPSTGLADVSVLVLDDKVYGFSKNKSQKNYHRFMEGTTDKTQQHNRDEIFEILQSHGAFQSPFLFLDMPREDWFCVKYALEHKSPIIFEEVEENDHKIIIVKFINPENKMVMSEFKFFKNFFWAIKETNVLQINAKGEQRGTWNTSCVYEGEHNGIPLLKKYFFTSKDMNGQLVTTYEFEFSKILLGNPDESVFDIQHFEKTDIVPNNDSSFWGIRLILFFTGLLFVLFAVFLMRRKPK